MSPIVKWALIVFVVINGIAMWDYSLAKKKKEGVTPGDKERIKGLVILSFVAAGGVGVADRGAEEDMRRRASGSRGFRVDDFRGVDALGEKADAPVDLAEPPLAVLIVGVFAAIAVAGGPGDHSGHRAPFPGEEKAPLVDQPLEAGRRDVVLEAGERRVGGFFRRLIMVLVFAVR